MTENNQISKIVKNILRHRKDASFDRSIMHPEREWFLGFLTGLIIMGGGIFWSTTNYQQYKNISVSNSNETEVNIVYRASVVELALSDLATRKGTYDDLKQKLFNETVSLEEVTPTQVIEPITENEATTSEKSVEVIETKPIPSEEELRFE